MSGTSGTESQYYPKDKSFLRPSSASLISLRRGTGALSSIAVFPEHKSGIPRGAPRSLLRDGAGEHKENRGRKCCPRVRDSRSSVIFRYQRGEEADVTTGCRHRHREEQLDNGGSAALQAEV